MKVKFGLSVNNDMSYSGAVTYDGKIEINMERCNRVDRVIYVVLHELIHWILDAFSYPIRGQFHYWNDLLCTYFFLYKYKQNKKDLRKWCNKRYVKTNS